LDVDAETAWRRASTGQGRPLARDRGRFEQLLEERRPVYEDVADALLPAIERGTVRKALPALGALARWPHRPLLVWAASESGEYPVFFGRGLVAGGFFHPEDARRFAVTDATVAQLHRVQSDWSFEIAAGEQSKTPVQA